MTSITPEEHLAWILDRIGRLPAESLPIAEAAGRTLAEPVFARHPLPLWDNSAMDGYALRSEDVAAAGDENPVPLTVVGEVRAGAATMPRIAAGEAVRIMTGAPIPDGADAVVALERTASEHGPCRWADATVLVHEAAGAGRNIRLQGEDVPSAAQVAAEGEELSALRVAALVAAGIERVSVSRSPRVAVIATGAELRRAGEPLAHGQIRESNTSLIAGLLRDASVQPVSVEHCSDDADTLSSILAARSRIADVIVTTGGIGPGVSDVTRIALEGHPDVKPVHVAIRPARPQSAGRLRSGAFVFALPGNPVSAAVSFELFIRPALLAVQGRERIHRLRIPATAASDWPGVKGRLQVLPVTVRDDCGALLCAPAVNPRGVSHAVGGQGSANGFALVGPERGDVRSGETVPVVLVGAQ